MSGLFLFDRITIIGLGLIGSSIARAAHKKKLAETIVGCDENDIAPTFARSHKFIDVAMHDMKMAVKDSDLVILAVRPASMGDVAKKIGASLKKGAIVMDVASVKRPVMEAISAHLPSHVDYIPAHPIAGSELSGTRAGKANLFEGKRVIVTPNEPLQDDMLRRITAFWSAIGAKVEGIPPDLHDLLYAHVSHLPSLLSFAAKHIITDPAAAQKQKKFLRLSHASTELWTEIFLLNQANVLSALDRYLDVLWHIKGELAAAPEGEESKQDDALARNILFPRIAASCLITTVMEAEKQAGFSYARYAGTGFADFTSPATAAPEGDIEQIAQHYLPVLGVLQDYIVVLKKLRDVLAGGSAKKLQEALQ